MGALRERRFDDARVLIRECLADQPVASPLRFAGMGLETIRGRLFRRLEGDGYRGPYSMTFGNREQKLWAREYLLKQAGVA